MFYYMSHAVIFEDQYATIQQSFIIFLIDEGAP